MLKHGTQISDLIQVCVSLADSKTLDREIRAMMEVCGELKQHQASGSSPRIEMTIITDDEERIMETDRGPVRLTPLWKWLIREDKGIL